MTEHLVTGWERDLPVTDTVLRSFLNAYADRVAMVAEALGGCVRRGEEAVFADSGSFVPFDNSVILLAPPRDAVSLVREAAAFFRPGVRWTLFSAWPLPDLSGEGLTLVGHPPFMFRPPGGQAPPLPKDLKIVEAGTPQEVRVFESTLVKGYPIEPAGEGSSVGDPRVAGLPIRRWTGYAGGYPVAVAGAYVAHKVIEIEWVATLPHARGRGFGAAVTWAAVRSDPALPAVLLASDHGRPVYERLGFWPVLRLTVWWVPPRT